MQIESEKISLFRLVARRAEAISRSTEKDVGVTGVERRGEVYFFLWTDGNHPDVLNTLGKFADDPELSFTWTEATILSLRINGKIMSSKIPGGEK